MSNLTILKSSITQLDNLYSLTDLHRVSGYEAKHAPNRFIRLDTTQELVSEIQKEDPTTQPLKTLRGTQGGTYACEELALAYAMWISPKFHLVVLRAFLAMHKGELQNQQQQLAIEHKKAVEPEKEVKPFTDKELQLLVRVWHHSETMRHWLLKLSDPLKWLNSSYADDAFEAQTFKRDLQDFRFLLIQHCEHIQRHTSSNIHPTAFEQMVYDMRKMCLRINTGREIINPI